MSLSLLKVQPSTLIGGEAVPAVNLRDLHQALEVSTQYKDWALRRISDSMAVDGRDFLTLKSEHNLKGGRPQIDHTVTLDLAKEIAMLERNEKGKQIRRYFIHVEKEFRKAEQHSPKPLTRREQLLQELAEIERLSIGSTVIEAIRPTNGYGTLAPNGGRRTGLRRAAWVANRRHRLEEALAIHRELRSLDQLEMNFGAEGGQS